MDNHSFKNVLVHIVAKFFNVMANNFASEINSKAHVAKKSKPPSSNTKIRKLQSQN